MIYYIKTFTFTLKESGDIEVYSQETQAVTFCGFVTCSMIMDTSLQMNELRFSGETSNNLAIEFLSMYRTSYLGQQVQGKFLGSA